MNQEEDRATTRKQQLPRRGRLGLWWPYLGDGAIILALSLWVGHPYLLAGNALISDPGSVFGDPYLHIGIALTNLDLLRQGVIPLGTAWFPSAWAGLPGAIGTFGLPSLVHWLIMGLTPVVGVYAAYNLVIFLNIVVAAASAYYLGHVVTGKRGAAIVAAAVYTYFPGSYGLLFESMGHIDLMTSYALLPLMFAFWERLLRQPTRRHTVLASLGTILVFLSYPQTGLYGAIYVAFRLAFQAIVQIRVGLLPLVRLVAASGVAGALALAVLLPVYIPALLLRPISRSYQDAADFSAPGARFALGEIGLAGVVLALGICGFRWWRHRRLGQDDWVVLLMVPIVAYFVMLAEGSFAPLPVLRFSFDYIPLMQTARATCRALNVAILGLSVISGYGLSHLAEGVVRRLGPKGYPLGVALSWVAVALVIGQYWLLVQRGNGLPFSTNPFLLKSLDTDVLAINRVRTDPQPARVLTLPSEGAGGVVGAVAKPDLTAGGSSDYWTNRSLFEPKVNLARSFENREPNLASQAALFGIKYVLLNAATPVQWGGGPRSSWGTFEIDFEDKKEGQASLRARWLSGAAGWATIAYHPSSAQDWRSADGLRLWVKFSQGDWGGYVVGLQDAAGVVAWQQFDYSSVDQWQETSLPLPFAPAPESFQWNRFSVVIGATDPSKSFTPLTIQVDGIRLTKQGTTIAADTATEAMFTLAEHLESQPKDFRLLSFEDGWFLFENLGFRGMAFELCPQGQPCDPVAIDYQRPDANTIRLGFDLDRKARLLVSETYHQGWAVNDPRVKVGQEQGLLALEVDQPGHYEVTLRYQPYDQFLPWVGLGWGGYLVAVAAMGLPWRRLGGRAGAEATLLS